jgi:hypothetical protein
MPSPSKNKGNSWERDVAKHLSELYGETFLRSQGSGAYIGAKNAHRKEFLHEGQIRSFKGDIIPGQSFPKFNCEAKSYADFPFHQLFQGNVKQLDLWIDQLMTVADPNDFNILIMKFNRKGKFVAVEFDKNRDEPLFVERHFIYESVKWGRWVIMDYTKFFELNKDYVAISSS